MTYTSPVSFWRMMKSESNAVKKGVVAPMAWLKLTGMKRRETLPPTTLATNTTANTATFTRWRRDLRACRGAMPEARTANESERQATMWHAVRKMGNLKPHTLSRYLLSKITPMLLKYHAAIISTVYALMLGEAISACGERPRARNKITPMSGVGWEGGVARGRSEGRRKNVGREPAGGRPGSDPRDRRDQGADRWEAALEEGRDAPTPRARAPERVARREGTRRGLARVPSRAEPNPARGDARRRDPPSMGGAVRPDPAPRRVGPASRDAARDAATAARSPPVPRCLGASPRETRAEPCAGGGDRGPIASRTNQRADEPQRIG